MTGLECVECGGKTTRLDGQQIPIHRVCEENRDEAAYMRSQARAFADGGGAPSTPAERMDDAHRLNREGRR